jgi:hypothetical protein
MNEIHKPIFLQHIPCPFHLELQLLPLSNTEAGHLKRATHWK